MVRTKKKQIRVYLSDALYEKLHREKASRGFTIQEVVERAISVMPRSSPTRAGDVEWETWNQCADDEIDMSEMSDSYLREFKLRSYLMQLWEEYIRIMPAEKAELLKQVMEADLKLLRSARLKRFETILDKAKTNEEKSEQ